eukprot:TRINITY_DN719_c0_g2_i1.p1 TRINITY_DN719_c0_g2~~TRINITY_DN719_c0_g2_i1.p1  ORF type:complete len:176 (+),score=34.45 TRINITY_DN719_c0_g2_i1:47-529(+)
MKQFGELDIARREMRNHWNNLILKEPIELERAEGQSPEQPNGRIRRVNPFWTNPEVLKAMVAQMELVEPIDELIYQTARLWEDSGSYWSEKNRPHRYIWCDELLRYMKQHNVGSWRDPKDDQVNPIRKMCIPELGVRVTSLDLFERIETSVDQIFTANLC